MKISVVTVCYNSAKTIRHTIESVINQNYHDIDYVIIDGGSTDGTVDIIKEYSDKISYWCSEKDNGIYDAMNKGISKSKGDIIAFMNSDDWYADNIFQKVAECFEKTNAGLVYGDFFQVWGSKRIEKMHLGELNLDDLHYKFLFCHQAVFVKRELFAEIGLYNINYKISADYEWILRAYVNKVKFAYLPEPICFYSFGGYSSVNRKRCAEEGRKIKLSLLPRDMEEEYMPKITQYYISGCNSILHNVLNEMLCGNNEVIKNVYSLLKDLDNNVILWGAGKIGIHFLVFLEEAGIHVLSIIDNNPQKWGLFMEGVEVKKPFFADDCGIKVIIAVKESVSDIKKQLADLGYSESNIISYEEIRELIINKMGR